MISFINPCHAKHAQSSTSVDSITLLLNGDSLIASVADSEANKTALINDLSSHGVMASIQDMAQGGTTLTYESGQGSTNWWDERTDVIGVIYSAVADPISSKSDYTDIVVSLGTNDHGLVYGTLTKGDLVDDYSNYLDQLKNDFSNLERIYIAPMARHSYSANDAQWQLLRDVQYQLAEDRADCYILPEFYDLALADTVHLNSASVTIRSDRYASRISYILGMNNKPTLGMEIVSAAMDDDGCLCAITHHDGNDWTLPDASTAKKLFRSETNGAYVDLSNHTIEKVSSTQLRIKGAPWSAPTLQTVWGTMGLIAGGSPGFGANITPDLPHDNSTLELPFMYSAVVPVDNDVIRSITNLAYEVRPSYEKTYDSDIDVATVQSINGKSFSNVNSGNFMTYDTSAFGGAGGFNSTSTNTILSADNGWAAQYTAFVGVVVDIPAIISGSSYLWAFGTSNSISTAAQAYFNTSGNLMFSQNGANITENLGGDFRGGRTVFLFNFTSDSNCDVYANDTVTKLGSFDPKNTYGFTNDLFFGGGSTNFKYGSFFAKLGAHDAVNDPSLAAIMSDLKNKYGVS